MIIHSNGGLLETKTTITILFVSSGHITDCVIDMCKSGCTEGSELIESDCHWVKFYN